MKKITAIICLTMVFNANSQVAPLEDYTWYLEKLIINGTTTYTPQDYTITSQFWDSLHFSYEGCSDFHGLINYANNQNFSIGNGSIGDQVCNGPIDDYDLLYIYNFLHWDMYLNPYSYSFSDQGNLIILTITNSSGDEAIYQNQQLGVNNIQKTSFSLFPNPANEYFTLEGGENEIEKIIIYNLFGKEIKTFRAQENYHISELSNGIYFVKITDIFQRETIQKLIKK